jgi:hypothetical protein
MLEAAVGPIISWVFSLRGAGWFAMGNAGPFPARWQGWCLFFGFILAILGTLFLPRDLGWPVRVAAGIAFLAIGYWTVQPNDAK